MRPGLDQLEALLWISRLGSFRKAAHHLRLSQPAVSGRIQELEAQLGFRVVDRAGYRPRITAEGQEVLRYAEQAIGLAESFRRRVTARRLLPASIRMGAADSFALTHLSRLLLRVEALHPGTRIDLDIDFSANLDRKLQAGELDIAVLTAPTRSAAVHVEPLMDLVLGWLASPRLGLQGRRLAPAELVQMPVLTNPRPSHLYRTVLDWFATAGLVPQRLGTCNSLTIMAKLTADGAGVAVLPVDLLREELRSGRLLLLDTAPGLPPHRSAIAWRMDGDAAALAAVADLVRDVVAGVDAAGTG